MLLHIINDFEYLFNVTLGKFNIDPVEIELNPDSKPLSSRYYPDPDINK